MNKDGKQACDWCGRVFRKTTPRTEYNDGTVYHHHCLKSVGGRTDLGHTPQSNANEGWGK